MSKLVKLTNNTYLSSESIIHKRGGGNYYLSNLLDNIYPIGSIFISTNTTNPSTYFGGTWERIKGRFLLAADDSTYKIGSTGGDKEHQHLLPIAVDNGIDNWSVMQWNASFGYGTQSYWSPNRNNLNNRATAEGIWLQQLKSKKESNMPPYLVVYIWKRIA